MKKIIWIILLISFSTSIITAQSIFIAGFNSLQKATLGTSCSPTTIGFYDPNNTTAFDMTDIAFHPNGNLYGVSTSGFYTIDTLTGLATLINTHTLFTPNAMVSDNNGTMYVADYNGGFYSVDVNTGVPTSLANFPVGAAGDLAFYNGLLYMADVNNNLVTIDLTANPITTTIVGQMNIGMGLTVFGILTYGTDCQNAQFLGGSNSLYIIDPLTAQTTFLCNVGNVIAGISAPSDFLGSDCFLRIDLDADNSSGAQNIHYDIDTTCSTILTIADTDVSVFSSEGTLDSIQIWISNGILNGNNEFLSYTPTNNITAVQNSATSITLLNNGNASFADFENAILNISYQNSAVPLQSGWREISFIAYKSSLVSNTAQTTFYLNYPHLDLGNDTISCGSITLDISNVNGSILWDDNSNSPIRTITQSGDYFVTLNNSCTIITDSIHIDIFPTYQTTIDTIICSPNTVNIAGISHNVSGNYSYTLQTVEGCDSTITLNLVVNQSYQLMIDTIICDNETLVVNGITHDTTGLYQYNLQTWQGCDSMITLDLTVEPAYQIFITDTICQNESFQLGQQFFDTTGIYELKLSCDSIITLDLTVFPVDTTIITIEVCDATFTDTLVETYVNRFECDSFVITNWVYNGGFLNLPDTIICSNEIYSLDFTNISTDVLWQDGSNNLTYDISDIGTYIVSVTNLEGCTDIDTFEVDKLYPIDPNYNLPTDTIKCIGADLLLNAYTPAATDYIWTGEQAHYQQNTYIDSLFLVTDLLEDIATISVKVTNRCGGFTHFFEVKEEDCSCEPFIPNVFTPNEDGRNDVFNVYNKCELTNFNMVVFDRWGSKVYATDNINNGWDGTINGKTAHSGVYVYVITFDTKNKKGIMETKQRSGSVTLVR